MTTTSETEIESSNTSDRHPLDSAENVEVLGARLSPDRKELLQRTWTVRRSIGRVRENVADLISEMRETGD